jgi:hypothetical protein
MSNWQRLFTFLTVSRGILLRMRNISNKICRKNQNTHFMFNKVFRKSCRLWDNVETWGGARETAHGNMAAPLHAGLVRLHARSHTPAPVHPQLTHKHSRTRTHTDICKIYCFSTATMVLWTRLNVTLRVRVHCLSCYYILCTQTYNKTKEG